MAFTTPEGVIVGADPATPPAAPPPVPQTFTADDVARARQQEKDKLYQKLEDRDSQLKALQEEVARIAAERDERIALEAQQREEAERDLQLKRESEMDVRELLQKKEQEFEQRFEELRREAQQKEVLLQREQEYRQLVEYREQRKAQEAENIMPHLLDYVDGGTPDEIEASIARLRETSSSILEDARAAAQTARASQPGVRTTAPAAGPLDTYSENTSFTAEDIAAMSMNDYIKNRGKFGLGGGGDRGIFR